MSNLNESSSFEEWLAALCEINDFSEYLKQNPDFRKKCPWKELTGRLPLNYPQYGPIRANAMFWADDLCSDKPELYEYFDWREGLKQMESLVAKTEAPQCKEEDRAALDFLFLIFHNGFSNRAFSCSQRQWVDLEKRVREAAHKNAFRGMADHFWLTSKDYLDYYTQNDIEFDRSNYDDKPGDCVKVLSEEDWRTLLDRKPDFCTKNQLFPDEMAEEAVFSRDLALLKCASGMGADLCSLEVLSEAFFPNDGGISMPIVSYLIEEKKIHEKMNNSPDEEKRSWFLSCIQGLAEEGNAYLAEYLIAQAGDSKKAAVRAALTGAARGWHSGTFIDLWENYQEITADDEELRAAIARKIFASRIDNDRLWNTCEILGTQDFSLAKKDILPIMTKMLKATHEVMCSFCRNDHFPSENADIVEIARSIVSAAEDLKAKKE